MVIKQENLGVKNISSFYKSLKEEYMGNDEIVIDFKNVKRIDLSVVQVVVAAGRSGGKEGKQVKLKSLSDDVKNQIMLCGMKI